MHRTSAALKLPALCVSSLLLVGCVSATVVYPNAKGTDGNGAILPVAAIQLAANAEGRPVPGVFLLHVQATGRQDGNIYLNSQSDYRDQRNLTVEIRPSAIIALQRKFGEDPDKYFQDKDVLVSGSARRVKILFHANGKPSGLYYYQTHVVVSDTGQIQARS